MRNNQLFLTLQTVHPVFEAQCACLQQLFWPQYLPWTALWSKGMWDLCKSAHPLAQWSQAEWCQTCRHLFRLLSLGRAWASVSRRQRLHLNHRRPRTPAQLHHPRDHRRPAVWKGIKRCLNSSAGTSSSCLWIKFTRTQREPYLASRLGHSDAARWFGRSRSCQDPRL